MHFRCPQAVCFSYRNWYSIGKPGYTMDGHYLINTEAL